jgi:hypothetical protein
MTDQSSSITPPPELVQQWFKQAHESADPDNQLSYFDFIATAAAQWGADQELGACVELLRENGWHTAVRGLRAARRPKPPTLKEQALADLEQLLDIAKANGVFNPPDTIRRALEQLND